MNLNKINLGFNVSRRYWRENTETIFISQDDEVIQQAKDRFLEVFSSGYSVEEKLAEKLSGELGRIFNRDFGLRSRKEVKILFAKLVYKKQIDVKKFIMKIAKITSNLMKYLNKTTIGKEDFIAAIILYYLSERKQDKEMLQDKLVEIEPELNVNSVLFRLTQRRLIELEGDFYKIRLDTLLGETQ